MADDIKDLRKQLRKENEARTQSGPAGVERTSTSVFDMKTPPPNPEGLGGLTVTGSTNIDEMIKKALIEQEIKIRAEYGETVSKDDKITNTDQARMDRAEIHLKYLTKELMDMLKAGAMVGPLRKSGAEMMQQFMGDVQQWPPLKIIREVLTRAREKANMQPAKQDRTLKRDQLPTKK